MQINLLPISEAPKDAHILVFGNRNPRAKTVHVTYSQWLEKAGRWEGYTKENPPKWFADMREISWLLE
jgi:hypothetical protein